MDIFDYTLPHIWQKRRDFIDKEIELADIGSYDTCDHAVVLFMDMSRAYCAGAWISVIIMSVSVIDSHLRETEAMNDEIGTAKLLNDYYKGDDIDWLRKLRNRYVHYCIESPILESNDFFDKQEELEEYATTAIKMAIKALFQRQFI